MSSPPSASAPASPSAAASPSSATTPSVAGVATCSADRLTGAITAWEGAAGSRIGTIVVTNSGLDGCILEGPPGAALIDGSGAVLVASDTPVGGGDDFELSAGAGAQLLVAVGNWCNDPPRPPVSIGLTMPDGSQVVVGPGAGGTFEPPPCNGPGLPATIDVQPEGWTPAD